MKPDQKPFLIAEIGINHNGDIELAKKMIYAASDAGFDAVKFQKRTINIVYSKDYLDGERESPWGDTQRAQKEGLEFSAEEYDVLNAYCKELNIQWTASCWDLESLTFLQSYNPPFHKVASPMLGHFPLLRAIASDSKHTFISTGMSSIEEIDEVVDIFQKEQCPFELMHCNSTYPMPMEDANLLSIKMLKDRYKCDVGYSGHETSLVTVCIAAVALGATSLERHITLDRTMYGSDQAASLEPIGMKSLVNSIQSILEAYGTPKLGYVHPEELPIAKKLRSHIK